MLKEIFNVSQWYMRIELDCFSTKMPSKPTGQEENKCFDQNLSLRGQQTDHAAGPKYFGNNVENCAFPDDFLLQGENYHYYYYKNLKKNPKKPQNLYEGKCKYFSNYKHVKKAWEETLSDVCVWFRNFEILEGYLFNFEILC